MDGEVATHAILSNDASFGAIVGVGSAAKIFYDEAKQTETLPLTIVSLDGIDPCDNKDGPSTLDFDWVYVYHYASTKKQVNEMARAARTALDRKSGTFLSVITQSVEFITQRSSSEYIDDKPRFCMEQLYKLTINL